MLYLPALCYGLAPPPHCRIRMFMPKAYNELLLTSTMNKLVGSLVLRAGKSCLTQTQLDSYQNQDVARFHPLNCAKINAKPYPYFDAGLMFMRVGD